MAKIWELDFYSRPILDENDKKKWELLICEAPLDVKRSPLNIFYYNQFCSSKTVNSIWLKEAIEKAINEAGETPQKIRFFRRQMNNMITKACEEIGIPADLSRRTYTLNEWLKKRMEEYYPQQPGYTEGVVNAASVQYQAANPAPLPDAVRGNRGDKWSFVSLEAGDLEEMNEWDIAFGEAFPLSLVNVAKDTPIPGLIIFSARALPLAGWMSGLEIAYLQFQGDSRPIICLETGINEKWILAPINDPKIAVEAQEFEAAKQKAEGVHFLAIQSDPEAQSFAGFWLLKE